MTLLRRIIKRAITEVAAPALAELGRNVGNAIGARVGRHLDPEGAELERMQAEAGVSEEDEEETEGES